MKRLLPVSFVLGLMFLVFGLMVYDNSQNNKSGNVSEVKALVMETDDSRVCSKS